ncbi:hypothetical protein BH18GEM1_BH18GEM1_02120 [soil metagenome]
MQGMPGMGSVMEGMLWASLFMIAVPLLIGVGVAVVIFRRRAAGEEGVGPGSGH